MATKRLAILGASAVQDDAAQAAHTLGIEVHVLAASANGPAAESADHFAAIDFSNIDAVEKYVSENNIDVVYSTGSDIAIPVSAEVSRRLSLPSFVSPETARTCNIKTDMRRALAGAPGNVPAQRVDADSTAAWDGRWPVIVKPADAQGQRGITKVEDPAELEPAIEAALPHSRIGQAIIEEFVEGPEVSVNGYLVNGELIFVTVSDRETWPEFVGLIASHVLPSAHIDQAVQQRTHEVFTEAAKRLGIENGPIYAQVIIRDGEPYIIEITPRLDGCHMWKVIQRAQGVDLMRWTLSHLVFGELPQVQDTTGDSLPVRLDFHCQPPETVFVSERFTSPDDSVERYSYYRDGDTVRPVNGQYEKVGYDIRA